MGASEELPRIKDEVVGPMGLGGRPWWSAGLPGAPTAPKFGDWDALALLDFRANAMESMATTQNLLH